MEGSVPGPLRINSPVVRRRDSQPYIPSPLQAGTPVSDFSNTTTFSPSSSTLHRPSHDRLSSLFPSRPSSAAPTLPPLAPVSEAERRQSIPSPLLPAAQPAYKIPRAPAPPSFSEHTAYEPHSQGASNAQKPSRSRSLLNRISSLRGPGNSKYGRLEDDDVEPGHRRNKSKGPLQNVTEEDDEGVGYGYDISGFEGPIALQSMSKDKKKDDPAENEELDPAVAGFAAEFHRLEAAGRQAGVLGGGMTAVIESPFVYNTPQPQVTHRRGLSKNNLPVREDAQKQAEKTGEILVVTEAPVDISNLGGGDYDTGTPLSSTDAKKSYYFPEDPEQPNWRPMSMHWSYIAFLITIALTLAGIQEYLCQVSIRRAHDGKGLLEFYAPNDLTMTQYFSWKYAPTLVLVTYGVLWQISDFEVKRLEPYYQLSKKTGATAAESINNDYLTFVSYLIPFKSSKYKQWAVTLSSMSYLIAGSLVPVLQSASVQMYPEKEKRQPDELKFVRIDPRWSRAVTACLSLVAVLGVILIVQLRRKSGLLSDPKGIAGIAAMATRSHILNDFQGLDTAAQHVIHKQLRHRRYILHKSSLWQGEYIRHSTEEIKKHKDPRPIMLRKLTGFAYIGFIAAVMALIPVFMFVDAANKVIEKLPWLLTAIATSIKLLWGTMDCDVRLMEPFFILSRRRAPPATLTLDYTGTIPGYLSIKALLNRHYLVALVGLGAIMTELLTVCVSSFSVDGKKFFKGQGHREEDGKAADRYNTDETFKSFWVSFTLVLVILLSLILIASLVYLRRTQKFVPRQVGTIASVLAFIHQSKMLLSFVGTERMDSKQMTKYLQAKGGTYGIGWFTGRDGQDHCGIDEEPLHSSYKWGVDWRQGRMARIDTWDRF